MTRDDAIKAVRSALSPPGSFIPIPGVNIRAEADEHNIKLWEEARRFVDAAASLGLLRLERPRSFPERIFDFVSDTRLAQGLATERIEALWVILDDCGLKLVEK